MSIKEHEDWLEKRIKDLENMTGYGSALYDEVQHEISDLKHQLWRSRL